MNGKNKVKLLRECFDFSSPQKLDRFEEILFSIKTGKQKDLSILPELYEFFSDEVDDYIIFALIHTVESFPEPESTQCFLGNIEKIYNRSAEWTTVLFLRIINNEKSLKILKDNQHFGNKETLIKITDNILQDKYCNEKQREIAFRLKEDIRNIV